KLKVDQTLFEDHIATFEDSVDLPATDDKVISPFQRTDEVASRHVRVLLRMLNHFVRLRWQMLDENFMPPLGKETSKQTGISLIDRCAENLVFMLGFMEETRPDLYSKLQDDLRYL